MGQGTTDDNLCKIANRFSSRPTVNSHIKMGIFTLHRTVVVERHHQRLYTAAHFLNNTKRLLDELAEQLASCTEKYSPVVICIKTVSNVI